MGKKRTRGGGGKTTIEKGETVKVLKGEIPAAIKETSTRKSKGRSS